MLLIVLGKNFSRHFNFFLLVFSIETKVRHFLQIVSLGDYMYVKPYFQRKMSICNLLN